MSINKYMYISSHKFLKKIKSGLNIQKQKPFLTRMNFKASDLKNGSLNKFQIKGGLEFSSIADVLAGTDWVIVQTLPLACCITSTW